MIALRLILLTVFSICVWLLTLKTVITLSFSTIWKLLFSLLSQSLGQSLYLITRTLITVPLLLGCGEKLLGLEHQTSPSFSLSESPKRVVPDYSPNHFLYPRIEGTYWIHRPRAWSLRVKYCQWRTMGFLLMVRKGPAKSCTHTHKLSRLLSFHPVSNLDLRTVPTS